MMPNHAIERRDTGLTPDRSTRHFSSRLQKRTHTASLPRETSLDALQDRRILCVMDDDNLRIALRSLGFALSYRALHARLAASAGEFVPWVVLCDAVGAVARGTYLAERDWHVLQIPRQTVLQRGVPTVKGNADLELAFLVGRLSNDPAFDTVLLGTGDGDLAVAIARSILGSGAASVYTLSVSGSSSARLADHGLFAGRIFIGRDLVVPLRRPIEARQFPPALGHSLQDRSIGW